MLTRSSPTERLGLTLCYEAEDSQGRTEIFIDDIHAGGLAERDGRLRLGDQIVQVWLLVILIINIIVIIIINIIVIRSVLQYHCYQIIKHIVIIIHIIIIVHAGRHFHRLGRLRLGYQNF